jgi:DNA polymerase-3 subunit delta
MANKSYKDIERDLHNRIYAPVYLFQGEEPYYIDKLSDHIEQDVLDEMGKEFNQTIMYGKDSNIMSLVSTAKRYPMMSDYQVVILKEAQEMRELANSNRSKSDDDDDEGGESGSDALAPLVKYVSQPLSSTVLVLCFKYKNLDKRTKLFKAIEKNGVIFDSAKKKDSELQEWIEKYLGEKKQLIEPKAAALMAEHIGNDLSRIANECDKLMISLRPGETINSGHIEEYIGISKEFNVFELQNALGKKDVLKAMQIVHYFSSNPRANPLPMTMGTLYSYFTKLLAFHALPEKTKAAAAAIRINPYFFDQYALAARNYPLPKLFAISGLLREYDMKSKGVDAGTAGHDELLRELVYKIMH